MGRNATREKPRFFRLSFLDVCWTLKGRTRRKTMRRHEMKVEEENRNMKNETEATESRYDPILNKIRENKLRNM